jgi:hypothetical protein
MVEQEEGRELLPEFVVAEDRVHGKAVAHPVRVAVAVDAVDFFHGISNIFMYGFFEPDFNRLVHDFRGSELGVRSSGFVNRGL